MSLRDDWATYLGNLEDVTFPPIAARTRQLWDLLPDDCPTPHAGPTEKSLILSWDSTRYHLEVEVYVDSAEWFFDDRVTDEYWGGEGSIPTVAGHVRAYLRVMSGTDVG